MINLDKLLANAEKSLEPVSDERLTQIIRRILFHFKSTTDAESEAIFNNYYNTLRRYPEDLICAAYVRMLWHCEGGSVPHPADFIAVMEPEMRHRTLLFKQLDKKNEQ